MNYLHLIFFGMLFEKNGSDFPPVLDVAPKSI
jgi:hypothetical protein